MVEVPERWQTRFAGRSNEGRVAIPSRGSVLRRLDELSGVLENQKKKLSNPAWVTLTGNLEKLKNEVRYCFADAGSLAQDALREVTDLIFEVSEDPSLQAQSQTKCTENLDRLIGLVETVRERLQAEKFALVIAPERRRAVDPFPTPDGTSWEEVSIRFLSDHRVSITVRSSIDTRNYAEMGFADRRGGNRSRPDSAWELLRKLAEQGGTLTRSQEAGVEWRKVEKRIQQIRGRLRLFFQIHDDPFHPFQRVHCYQARFGIECDRSYEF